MALERFAVISDIHGNRWALEAVLSHLKERKVAEIINLGDSFYGPLDPCGTAEILSSNNFHSVMGNEDRIIISPPPEIQQNATMDFLLNSLSRSQLNWIRKLPFSIELDGSILLIHGTAISDDEYLLSDVSPEGVLLRNSCEARELIPEKRISLVLCGHDHIARTVMLEDGCIIHNPGSVGLQAFDDDLPFPHVIENGSPHARFSIVTRRENSWTFENVVLPYDWTAAAKTALKNKRENWAVWLETGRV